MFTWYKNKLIDLRFGFFMIGTVIVNKKVCNKKNLKPRKIFPEICADFINMVKSHELFYNKLCFE